MTELTVEKAAVAEDEVGLIAPTYPLPRLELARGRGARVWDKDGVERLDFVSGIAVNAFGHAPKGLVRAIAHQARELGHVSNLYANRPAIELAKALTRATGYERVFFANSGTEGIEAALKFCRARASAKGMKGRDLVAFTGGFHGRTGFALSATWNPPYRAPFEPLIPGVRFAPFNDVDALAGAITEETCGWASSQPIATWIIVRPRSRPNWRSCSRVSHGAESSRCGFSSRSRLPVGASVGLYFPLSNPLASGKNGRMPTP